MEDQATGVSTSTGHGLATRAGQEPGQQLRDSVPVQDRLWTRDDCAAYLRVERTTMPEIEALPDYPAPTRVTGATGRQGPSNRRWFAGDVIDFARSRKG